jgi:hypothetical protein
MNIKLAVLSSEQSKKGNLTLIDLEIIMNQHWTQLNRRKPKNKQNNNWQVLLTAFSGSLWKTSS